MSEEAPGVVFDCNLFIQAAISSLGPAFACMNLVDQASIRLIVSPEVLTCRMQNQNKQRWSGIL